ncbi:unnamed protein product [Rhizoctonia solani]|uniref:O-methylsterigmatocystin oxidoreductase n=1 Tax=Rhizoctonia solani TaxID=456999 RepID=A0A8H3HIU7_9AGAM|nr:unnamed protein product [Rhizoctonia solani]
MWILLISITAVTIFILLKKYGNSSLPPGPPGVPLLGNALEIRDAPFLWLKLDEYAQTYGSIFTIRLLGRPAIVLSDPDIVTELFEKRAVNFANRPLFMMAKLVGWTEAILFVPYGPRLHFQSLQIQELRKLMKRLVQEPEAFLRHAHLYAGAVSIRMTYGHTVRSFDDIFMQEAEEFMKVLNEGMLLIDFAAPALMPGRWLVEMIPLLRFVPVWFPGATFKRKAKEWAESTNRHRQAPFDYVVKNLAEGTAEPSFTSKLLDPEDGREVSESEKEMIKIVASGLYAAGADTTVSLLQSFFLAMTLHPHIQPKAQAEIDAYLAFSDQACSPTRILTIADRELLPYTHAVVSELVRWHPVANTTTRYTQEDEIIGQYIIPKGTMVIGNLWSMLHKPDIYADPENFWPERFLGENPPLDPSAYAFGFGRRICPGIHIAQQSLWITISNILANFTINKLRTVDGEELTPPETYTADILSRPQPFECSIKPRSAASQSFVNEVEL